MNAATLRVQRYSQLDGSGDGSNEGPTRLTANHLGKLTVELAAFETEMRKKLSPAFKAVYNPWLLAEGGRLLMVMQFVESE